MGQSLEKPIIEKHTSVETNGRLIAASASMQGYRISNEDAHNIYTKVDISKYSSIQEHLKGKKSTFSFFGIFDGHSGAECSQFLSNNLLNEILRHEETKLSSDKAHPLFSEDTLKQAFIQTDEKFFKTAMGSFSFFFVFCGLIRPKILNPNQIYSKKSCWFNSSYNADSFPHWITRFSNRSHFL